MYKNKKEEYPVEKLDAVRRIWATQLMEEYEDKKDVDQTINVWAPESEDKEDPRHF